MSVLSSSGAVWPISWGRSGPQLRAPQFDAPVFMNICVDTAFGELRSSLETWARLRPGTHLVALGDAGAGDVIFTTMTDCSPQECQYFATKGRKLVILAALPSDRARDVYMAAGAAAYIPMDGGTLELEAALRAAMAHEPGSEAAG